MLLAYLELQKTRQAAQWLLSSAKHCYHSMCALGDSEAVPSIVAFKFPHRDTNMMTWRFIM